MNQISPLFLIASKLPKLLALLLCFIAVTGCNKHHYTETQLLGSWQLDVQVADARVTYYTNHMWVETLTSSDNRVPNGSEFGSWKLSGNKLETVTFSTLNGASSDAKDVAKIDSLNESNMVEISRNKDISANSKMSSFHKVDGPCPLMTDDELAKRLVGTWVYSYTNSFKHFAVCLFSSYQSNGTALWNGSQLRNGQEFPVPNASGIWRIEQGGLFTTITNIEQKGVLINKESRDEIVFVTDSDFIFREESGVVRKELKQ